MNLIDFTKKFPNEEACEQHLKALRIRHGVTCSKCGCTHHYWKGYRKQWECKKCGHRTSLTSRTVMHGSKLPLTYWFIAIHLLTSTKKTFSACELQRQLGHKRYQPIWELLHKLRDVMGQRDEMYTLSGEIELDEGFFSADSEDYNSNMPRKRGRGSEAKEKVLVVAQSKDVKHSKRKDVKKSVGFIKMRVISDLKAQTMDEELMDLLEEESRLTTDASTTYTDFKNMVEVHKPQKILPKDVGKILPWVHIVISNAKRQILDIFHSVKDKYLQSYLNEFCYKFNRRYFDLFDRLMIASVLSKPTFKHLTYSKNMT